MLRPCPKLNLNVLWFIAIFRRNEVATRSSNQILNLGALRFHINWEGPKGFRKHQKGRCSISGVAGYAPQLSTITAAGDLQRDRTAGETASNGTATMCLCSSWAAAYVW